MEMLSFHVEKLNFDQQCMTDMSSLKGYIKTTYDTLKEIFGDPQWVSNDPEDKVLREWMIYIGDKTPETDRAGIATIYCWKVANVPYGEYEWHIGGHSEHVVDLVNRYVSWELV
jgi:hypothetical protein